MSRRRRYRATPRKTPNPRLIAIQIVLLLVALIAVIATRDRIGLGAGILVDSLSSEDVQVESNGGDLHKEKEETESQEDPLLEKD